MDALQAQCSNAKNYPKNIPQTGHPQYAVDLKHRQLNEQAHRVFCNEEKATVNFLEYNEDGKGFWDTYVTNATELQKHLGVNSTMSRCDPWCRYFFVSAPSSRDKLNITHHMLMLCFTYFQVMQEFVDFVLVFGRQSRAQQFHFGAFRHRTRLHSFKSQSSCDGPKVANLAWTGRDLQICYNLKSMEPSSQGDWPWSPRDCMVNHIFDMDKTRITWIMIKGDTLIEDRIRSASKDQNPSELSSFQTLGRAFASTLATHLILCDWAAENWDQFIVFLEARFHEISRRAGSNEIDIAPVIIREGGGGLSKPRRTGTGMSAKSILSGFSRAKTETLDSRLSIKKDETLPSHSHTDIETGLKKRPSPATKEIVRVEFDFHGQRGFSFSDLQALNYIHDKLKEAILILKLNMKIMSQLRRYYETTLESKQFPAEILRDCGDDLLFFKSRIDELLTDLQMCIMKLETLGDCVEGCKTLLHGILDYQNKESNKLLASHSGASTLNMESMAVEMNDIARKTKTETVSMKVITLVTLAFLPGTFISTLMSTDIFQGHDNNPSAPGPYKHLNPWQLYLALSLPLTAATLLFWTYFHFREKAREELKQIEYYPSRRQD